MRAHRPSFRPRRYRHDCFAGKWQQTAWRKTAPPGRQRGVSLFIVLLILLLSLILVLGGLAVATLNESLVGNQSDAQRAYGAAQALIDTAKLDILLNGRNCNAASLGGSGTNPTPPLASPGSPAQSCTLRFPQGISDYPALQSQIGGSNCGSGNLQGVCISNGPDDPAFAVNATAIGVTPQETWDAGAYYGLFAPSSTTSYDNSAKAGINSAFSLTLLSGKTTSKGRYWIEVFEINCSPSSPSSPSSSNDCGNSSGSAGNINFTAITGHQSDTTPISTYPFVFRITAMAYGIKSGTVSVLRTYYVPYVNNSGGFG
jgi:type IV pilus assembly protein PilX